MEIISRIIQAIRSFLNRRKKRILLSQKEEVIKDITKTLVEKAGAREEDVVIIFNPLDASNIAHGKELLG